MDTSEKDKHERGDVGEKLIPTVHNEHPIFCLTHFTSALQTQDLFNPLHSNNVTWLSDTVAQLPQEGMVNERSFEPMRRLLFFKLF